MPYALQLPNGQVVDGIDDDIPPNEAMALIRERIPEAFPRPRALPQATEAPVKKTGYMGAISKGIEQTASPITTYIQSLTGDTAEAAKAGLARQEQIGQRYEHQVDLEKIKEVYAKDGLVAATKEVLRQVPYATAENAPQIVAMIVGGMAGGALGSMVMPGVGTAGGALAGARLGAGLVGGTMMAGSNLERQAEAQQARGEEINPNLLTATGAGAVQAGLDVFALGKMGLGRFVGMPASTAEKELLKTAQRSFTRAVGRGAAVGAAAEIPTEVAQQVIERAQAGLPLWDEEAKQEYAQSAYVAGLLGPTIGGVAAPFERTSAKSQVEANKRNERIAAEEKRQAEEVTRKATPEYKASVEGLEEQKKAIIKARTEVLRERGKAKKYEKDLAPGVMDDLNAKVDAFNAQIAEINQRIGVANQSPEEYALEQMNAQFDARQPKPPAAVEVPEWEIADRKRMKQDGLKQKDIDEEIDVRRAAAGLPPRIPESPSLAQKQLDAMPDFDPNSDDPMQAFLLQSMYPEGYKLWTDQAQRERQEAWQESLPMTVADAQRGNVAPTRQEAAAARFGEQQQELDAPYDGSNAGLGAPQYWLGENPTHLAAPQFYLGNQATQAELDAYREKRRQEINRERANKHYGALANKMARNDIDIMDPTVSLRPRNLLQQPQTRGAQQVLRAPPPQYPATNNDIPGPDFWTAQQQGAPEAETGPDFWAQQGAQPLPSAAQPPVPPGARPSGISELPFNKTETDVHGQAWGRPALSENDVAFNNVFTSDHDVDTLWDALKRAGIATDEAESKPFDFAGQTPKERAANRRHLRERAGAMGKTNKKKGKGSFGLKQSLTGDVDTDKLTDDQIDGLMVALLPSVKPQQNLFDVSPQMQPLNMPNARRGYLIGDLQARQADTLEAIDAVVDDIRAAYPNEKLDPATQRRLDRLEKLITEHNAEVTEGERKKKEELDWLQKQIDELDALQVEYKKENNGLVHGGAAERIDALRQKAAELYQRTVTFNARRYDEIQKLQRQIESADTLEFGTFHNAEVVYDENGKPSLKAKYDIEKNPSLAPGQRRTLTVSKQRMMRRLEKLRQLYVRLVLKEVIERRAKEGEPSLSADESVQIAEIDALVRERIMRALAQPVERGEGGKQETHYDRGVLRTPDQAASIADAILRIRKRLAEIHGEIFGSTVRAVPVDRLNDQLKQQLLDAGFMDNGTGAMPSQVIINQVQRAADARHNNLLNREADNLIRRERQLSNKLRKYFAANGTNIEITRKQSYKLVKEGTVFYDHADRVVREYFPNADPSERREIMREYGLAKRSGRPQEFIQVKQLPPQAAVDFNESFFERTAAPIAEVTTRTTPQAYADVMGEERGKFGDETKYVTIRPGVRVEVTPAPLPDPGFVLSHPFGNERAAKEAIGQQIEQVRQRMLKPIKKKYRVPGMVLGAQYLDANAQTKFVPQEYEGVKTDEEGRIIGKTKVDAPQSTPPGERAAPTEVTVEEPLQTTLKFEGDFKAPARTFHTYPAQSTDVESEVTKEQLSLFDNKELPARGQPLSVMRMFQGRARKASAEIDTIKGKIKALVDEAARAGLTEEQFEERKELLKSQLARVDATFTEGKYAITKKSLQALENDVEQILAELDTITDLLARHKKTRVGTSSMYKRIRRQIEANKLAGESNKNSELNQWAKAWEDATSPEMLARKEYLEEQLRIVKMKNREQLRSLEQMNKLLARREELMQRWQQLMDIKASPSMPLVKQEELNTLLAELRTRYKKMSTAAREQRAHADRLVQLEADMKDRANRVSSLARFSKDAPAALPQGIARNTRNRVAPITEKELDKRVKERTVEKAVAPPQTDFEKMQEAAKNKLTYRQIAGSPTEMREFIEEDFAEVPDWVAPKTDFAPEFKHRLDARSMKMDLYVAEQARHMLVAELDKMQAGRAKLKRNDKLRDISKDEEKLLRHRIHRYDQKIEAMKNRMVELGVKGSKEAEAVEQMVQEGFRFEGQKRLPSERDRINTEVQTKAFEQQTGQVGQREEAVAKRKAKKKAAPLDVVEEAARLDYEYGNDDVSSIDLNTQYGGADLRYRLDDGTESISANEAVSIANAFIEQHPNLPLAIHATADEISPEVQAQLRAQGKDPAKVQGGVLPNGTILVVLGNHRNAADLNATFAHEVIGHYKADRLLFGTQTGRHYMNALQAKYLPNDTAAAELMYGLGFSPEVVAEVNSTPDTRMREIVARASEMKPGSLTGKAKRFFQEMWGGLKHVLREMGIDLGKLSPSDVFYIVRSAQRADFRTLQSIPNEPNILLRTAVVEPEEIQAMGREMYPEGRKTWQSALRNIWGLWARTMWVDRFAPLQAVAQEMADTLKALQLMYFARAADRANQFIAENLTHGPVRLREFERKDGRKEFMFASQKGTNLREIMHVLHGHDFKSWASYIALERAEVVGWDKLLDEEKPRLSPEQQQALLEYGRNNTAYQEARKLYREYNAELINLAEETGVLLPAAAEEMRSRDYIPFFRQDPNGDIVMMGEHPVKIGNIADQADIAHLFGSNKALDDPFANIARNTRILISTAIRNQAAKNTAFTMQELGLGEYRKAGKGHHLPRGRNVVHYKHEGEDYAFAVDTEGSEFYSHIPGDMLAKGLEGIATALPAGMRFMAIPAQILRAFITRNPLYVVRQLIRDPMHTWLATGVDFNSVRKGLGSVVNLMQHKDPTGQLLRERGLVGGQVIQGTDEDMGRIMAQLQAGQNVWSKWMSRLDDMAVAADAATRVGLYNDFVKKNASAMEATMGTMDSINFATRGVSPTMQWANMMIPFFNAQIQGLDSLYRAMTGRMPFNERMKARQRLAQRAVMLMGSTVAYYAMVQDEEWYKNTPETVRMSNWLFPPIPGLTNEPLRIPRPFEFGLMFVALPEAMLIASEGDKKADAVWKAMRNQMWNTVPGGSSMGMPAAVKPAIEVMSNHSFFTGRDVVPQHLEAKDAVDQYMPGTTLDISRDVSKLLNGLVSPIEIEHLVRGYTAGIGYAGLQLLNAALSSTDVPKPEGRSSEMMVVGPMFQRVDGAAVIQRAYEQVNKINATAQSFKQVKDIEQDPVRARQLAAEKGAIIKAEAAAGAFRQQMGELSRLEKQIHFAPRSKMDEAEKTERLKQIRQRKIDLANWFEQNAPYAP